MRRSALSGAGRHSQLPYLSLIAGVTDDSAGANKQGAAAVSDLLKDLRALRRKALAEHSHRYTAKVIGRAIKALLDMDAALAVSVENHVRDVDRLTEELRRAKAQYTRTQIASYATA